MGEREAFEKAETERVARERAEIQAELAEAQQRADERRWKRQVKIAKAKADGTYQTKKDKEREARAALLRQQFGVVNENDGVADDAAERKQPVKATPAKKLKRREMVTKDEDVTSKVEHRGAPKGETVAVGEDAAGDGVDWESATVIGNEKEVKACGNEEEAEE